MWGEVEVGRRARKSWIHWVAQEDLDADGDVAAPVTKTAPASAASRSKACAEV